MDLNDLRIIKNTPLFGTLPIEVMQRLLGNASPRVYQKGMMLFQQGEPAKAFFVVLDGWVKVYRTMPSGEEAVVGVFRRGETFAEAAMFLGGRYPACAEAVTQARLVRVDGVIFRNQIRESPDLALSMLASASYHLKYLVEQIEQIKLLSAPQRIADFIIQQCATREGACAIDLPYEKTLIASRLGMKPESFSRALAKLKPLGVSVNREHVEIADVQALVAFVEKGDVED